MNQNNLIETAESNKPAAQNAQECRKKFHCLCVSLPFEVCWHRKKQAHYLDSYHSWSHFLRMKSITSLLFVCLPPTSPWLVSAHRIRGVDEGAMIFSLWVLVWPLAPFPTSDLCTHLVSHALPLACTPGIRSLTGWQHNVFLRGDGVHCVPQGSRVYFFWTISHVGRWAADG